ncbi:MAG TPA: glutamate synthase central domain-containing protein, partial [Isosphaeraceae bacterium]|nr:glutamate synthase central domain-containing protein [Isosphaeraceae bacterium]
MATGLPSPQGLYDPIHEHDSCGVGFIVDLKGRKSHRLVRDGLQALVNLDHRGACGCENNTGDGAGVLIQIPHELLSERCKPLGIVLGEPGTYGVGAFFTSPDPAQQTFGMEIFEKIVAEEGQVFLGWRALLTDNAPLGASARAVEPRMFHALLGRGPRVRDTDAFERKLYVIRKRFETEIAESGLDDHKYFYFSSLSCRTLVYKGMLTPSQVAVYFHDDLNDPLLASAICMFHSRFSTNTFPSWQLAHPYRMISHNGEINTLRGNINWMLAREALFSSKLYEPGDLEKLKPIIREGLSDTACLDNAIELLVRSGYSLPHAMMMLIPEAWDHHESMSQVKKDFYQYNSCLMEPWDGPASVAFTDGKNIGAVLDRNGLRPSRYIVTRDDRVIMASEVGALEIAPENVSKKGRLEPGKMFLVDLEQGRIVDDEELKHRIASARPYGKWLREFMVALADLPPAPDIPGPDHRTLLQRQQAFGYTLEDLKYILGPMGTNGEEAIGSMGNDSPLAVLSDRAQPLFNYFKQLFAQVTNPPLDAIREELVTSVFTGAGGEGNLLEPGPDSCRQIALDLPIVDNDQMARLKQLDGWRGFASATLPMLFVAAEGAAGMERALESLFEKASAAIAAGASLIILSDRGSTAEMAAIPSLLACSGLHHYLVRKGQRSRAGLLIECGDAREVHHFAL